MPLGRNIGVCTKTTDLRVVRQNVACIKLCGNRQETHCREGCLKTQAGGAFALPFDEGIRAGKILSLQGAVACEAAIIHDGKHVTTFLYPLKYRAPKEMALLAACGLSARELEVMSGVSKGLTRAELTQKLGITKATLRTHMNNIYKKLPPDLRRSLQARRGQASK